MLELLGVELELLGIELGILELLLTELGTLELLGTELGTLELLGRELEAGITLLEEAPTTFVQVEREIQLLLFSQPQPL